MDTPPHMKSWVDLTVALEDAGKTYGRSATPEYAELLREAQRDSTQSSARVSRTSTRKNSPGGTPKSPPNSPNTEWISEIPETCLSQEYYINHGLDAELQGDSEIEDWTSNYSSRPDQTPPKYTRYVHPNCRSSIRRCYIGGTCLSNKHVVCTLAVSNIAMLIIGLGIGVWLTKRGSFSNRVTTYY